MDYSIHESYGLLVQLYRNSQTSPYWHVFLTMILTRLCSTIGVGDYGILEMKDCFKVKLLRLHIGNLALHLIHEFREASSMFLLLLIHGNGISLALCALIFILLRGNLDQMIFIQIYFYI